MPEGGADAATRSVDWVMAAIVGAAGLRSAWAAAGTWNHVFAVDPTTLVELSGATVADLAR